MFGPVARAVIANAMRAMLSESCVIEQEVITADGYGGQVSTWQPVQTVNCRVLRGSVSGMTGQGVEAAASREALMQTYRLIVPAGTPLAPNQRVTVGGNVYQIVAIADDFTDAVFSSAYMTRIV